MRVIYNITFQQIEAFLTAARFLNMSRAAEKLYISQPTLSKALQRFESGVGFQVFTRSNQGIALTVRGEYLYGALKTLYNSMDKAIKTAREILPEPSRTLRLAVPSSYDAVGDYGPLKELVGRYAQKYPDVAILEQLCDFQELRCKLEFGEVDIAVTHNFAAADIQGIRSRRICEYRLYLAMSARHPLAAYDKPPPEKLSEYTHFAVPHTNMSVSMEYIVARCNELGFTPKRVQFVDNFPTLLHMLRNKFGVSICGRFGDVSLNDNPNDIKYYPIELFEKTAYIIVAWYEEKMTREAKNFINMLPEDIPI